MQSFFYVFVPIVSLAVNASSQILIARHASNSSLLKSVILGFMLGIMGLFIFEIVLLDRRASFIANTITYAALSYSYFAFVNLGETARRIRILRELANSEDGLTVKELIRLYNAKEIIEKRIRRLIKTGQVRYAGGRYYINKPVMLLASRIVVGMKLLILRKKSEFDK